MQIDANRSWRSGTLEICICVHIDVLQCPATFWTEYDQRLVMQVSIASLIANLCFLHDCCVVSALVPLLVRMLQILPWWHGWKDSTPLLHTSSSRRKPTDAWRRLSFMNGDRRRLTLSLTTLGRKPPQENYSKNLANMRLPRSLESSMLASNSLTKCRCEHLKVISNPRFGLRIACYSCFERKSW